MKVPYHDMNELCLTNENDATNYKETNKVYYFLLLFVRKWLLFVSEFMIFALDDIALFQDYCHQKFHYNEILCRVHFHAQMHRA